MWAGEERTNLRLGLPHGGSAGDDLWAQSLGGSALVAGLLGGTSLFFRKKNQPTQNQKQD
jgi:hypothetical protein